MTILAPQMKATMRTNPGRESMESHKEILASHLKEWKASLAPLWPLEDFVAVNPFLGWTHLPFPKAWESISKKLNIDILPSLETLKELYQRGEFESADIASVLESIRTGAEPTWKGLDESTRAWLTLTTPEQLIEDSQSARDHFRKARSQSWTIADLVEGHLDWEWSEEVVRQISQKCAAHYDQGFAVWTSPWKGMPLFSSWKEMALFDRRMEVLGCSSFRDNIATLPQDPVECIRHILASLPLPASCFKDYLFRLGSTLSGWCASLARAERDMTDADPRKEDLVGLLAIRLAYDWALFRAFSNHLGTQPLEKRLVLEGSTPAGTPSVSRNDLVRWILLRSAETGYQRRLNFGLANSAKVPAQTKTAQPLAQMVFCIDVRSEVLRRSIEATTRDVETFGFAGFFGLPMGLQGLEGEPTRAQCPVLLSPAFTVCEGLHDCGSNQSELKSKRLVTRGIRKLWKQFQTGPSSCFSFIETFGPTYLWKMVTDSLGWTRPASDGRHDGVPGHRHRDLSPRLDEALLSQWPLEKQVDWAVSILRNLGLCNRMAPLVVLCGHHGASVNNPLQAGLDCGACGGHSGEVNARLGALVLNQKSVRMALAQRGIEVPETTWFLGATHNTTTDEIRFFPEADMPDTFWPKIHQLGVHLKKATQATRLERMERFDQMGTKETLKRSRDWSEVRPEWALAGNAAFIVAPRDRTQGCDLKGRAFLHHYEEAMDQEGSLLELIMTAPMIVASWINLQYYGSVVDNQAFGSGNKTLHQVVGNLGVIEGNGGDLRSGLPMQSLHDGTRWQHSPLRLLVVIEAPRERIQSILVRHRHVMDLVDHGWIHLEAIEGSTIYRWKVGSGHHLESNDPWQVIPQPDARA